MQKVEESALSISLKSVPVNHLGVCEDGDEWLVGSQDVPGNSYGILE